MFIEIATDVAVAGAVEAYGKRKDVAKWWKRFAHYVKNGKLAILIVGPGGVGKTTLSRFLCAPDIKVVPDSYDESLLIERFELPGGAVAELVTAPGQKRHLSKWEDIFDEVKKGGKTFGVINVAAYGYHSTPLSMAELRSRDDVTSIPFSKYLGDCRQTEIEMIGEVEKLLRRHSKPFWMLTLISKQDLWWPDRKNVERHYATGQYSEAIKRIEAAHSAAGFQHEFFSIALHSQNFHLSDEKVAQTSAGYDDAVKYGHQKKVLEIIRRMVVPGSIN